MYLKVISDLHLEFGVPYFPTPDVRDPETVVILAGDINFGARVHDFIGSLRNNFNYRAIIFVPGNHEYYKGNIDELNIHFSVCQKEFNEEYDNIFYLTEFGKVEIDGVTFLGGTMWTDGGKTLKDRRLLEPFMNDFRLIRYGQPATPDEKRFTSEEMYKRFLKFTDRLAGALEDIEVTDDSRVVLITHHMPDYQCIHPMYQRSDINGGFAVDLIDYVPSSLLNKIDVMVFGHTHSQMVQPIQIQGCSRKTQMICNPRGYPRRHISTGERVFENREYDDTLLYDLKAKAFE